MLIIILLLALIYPVLVDATVLSDAAAKLAVGQWAQVPMSNVAITGQYPAWDDGTDNPQLGGVVPGPAYDGSQPAWDATSRKLILQQAEHGRSGNPGFCPYGNTTSPGGPYGWPIYPHGCWKPTWFYDDATDHWDIGRSGQTLTGVYPHYPNGDPVTAAHAYGHISWDAVNRVMYVRPYSFNATGNTIEFFRYCATSTPSYCASQAGDWAQIASLTLSSGYGTGQQTGWHHTLNNGTLLYFDAAGAGGGCGALFGYSPVAGPIAGAGWRTIHNGSGCRFPTASPTLVNATRSTLKDLVIFGGNNLKWYSINGSGTITDLVNSPCHFHSTNGAGGAEDGFSTVAEDANTGDIYFVGCTANGQLWKLNPSGTGTWTLIDADLGTSGKICAVRSNNCAVVVSATSISTYGVIGYWKFSSAGGIHGEYWIYKPSAGSGDIVAPTVSITAPTAGASVSGPLVTVTASASDNIGVAGVQFKVDGTNVGAEDISAPYSIAWNSTTVTDGTHLITAVARDAAGNTTTSTTVNVTVSNGGGGGGNFATRCKQPGVRRCVDFNNSSWVADYATTPNRNYGSSPGAWGVAARPTIDAAMDASGGTGALRFQIAQGHAGGEYGQWMAQFSTDYSVLYGENQSFWYQFRVRMDQAYISNFHSHKIAAVTTGNDGKFNNYSSCEATGITLQRVDKREFVEMYQSCIQTAWHGPYWGFTDTASIPGDAEWQDARSSPFCLYSQTSGGSFRPYPPPAGNCFVFWPNEWMTFTVHVTLGPLRETCIDAENPYSGFSSRPCELSYTGVTGSGASYGAAYTPSLIQLYIAREGQPREAVIAHTIAVNAKEDYAGGANPGAIEKIGAIYFLPYNCASCEGDPYYQATAPANVWYDDLIISDNDPGDPGSTPPVVNAPSQIRVTRR